MILARMGQGAVANALIDQAQSRLQRLGMADQPVHSMLQLARAVALRADVRNVEADRIDRQARELYPKGLVISDADFAKIKLELDPFHGEWNYSIRPD
jgi:hypothetical protein